MILLNGSWNSTGNLAAHGADGLLVPLFFLLLVAVGVGGLLVAYTSLRGYKRFRRVMDWIGSFVRHVFLGLPLGVLLGFGGWGVWYVATADASTQAMVWEWVWNGVLVAVVLACLGWVTERVLTRFEEHKAALEEEDGELEGTFMEQVEDLVDEDGQVKKDAQAVGKMLRLVRQELGAEEFQKEVREAKEAMERELFETVEEDEGVER